MPKWPTQDGSVFFSSEYPKTSVTRALNEDRLRRLASGLLTADVVSDPAALIDANRWLIIKDSMPDAVLVDRTAALAGATWETSLFVATEARATPLELPGLTVFPREGSAIDDDLPWAEGLRISTDARTLVDNLAKSRTTIRSPARTLSQKELEGWMVRKYQSVPKPDRWLQDVRDRSLALATELGVPERGDRIEHLIGLTGRTRNTSQVSSQMRAHLAGLGWDEQRERMFQSLAEYLSSDTLSQDAEVPRFVTPPDEGDGTVLPFFEAYFSNFIEGTEFTIEEAERIIQSGKPAKNRPEDGHDILGTYRVVSDPIGRRQTSTNVDEYIQTLKDRHAAVLAGRPERLPGQFKQKANQAGPYVFVDPDLVEGTLRRGLALLEEVPAGFPRAVFALFVVSEVHPFEDGNGRAARVCMCAELSDAKQSRIIIPTVWRNEYLAGLRKASREQSFGLMVRVLAYAWRWTSLMPWHDRKAIEGQLVATNAILDSTEAERTRQRLLLP